MHPLKPVDSRQPSLRESDIQELLFRHPELLPVREIEPAYGPLIPLARELPTRAGPIDLAFVNPSGYLTFVETKLWRNSEARRTVLAQLLDYAKETTRWTYGQFGDALTRARGQGKAGDRDPLLEAVRAHTHETDQDTVDTVIVRTVGQSLRTGRFLLLIVGDEVHDQIADLVDYLQRFAHMQFTLALVELALYEFPAAQGQGGLLVVPHVANRTTEVVRAIVRVDEAGRIEATAPPDVHTTPTFEMFLSQIRGQKDAGDAQQAERLITELERDHGMQVDTGLRTGIAVRLESVDGKNEFRFLRISTDGRVRLNRLVAALRRAGLDPAIGIKYAEVIARWIPGARSDENGDLYGPSIPDRWFPLKLLTEQHREEYLRLVADTVTAIRKAEG